MNWRWILLSLTMAIFTCPMCSSLRSNDVTHRERVHLTDGERMIYQSVSEHINQSGTVPTRESLEATLSSPISEDVWAKLSAKMYYENGLIGAFFSNDESLIMSYVLQSRRDLGSIRDLSRRIQEFSDENVPQSRILSGLEFLYKSGYIDVRNNGEDVYFILPEGLTSLHMVSSLKRTDTNPEIFGTESRDESSAYFQEEPVSIEGIENQTTSPEDEEKPDSEQDYDFGESVDVAPAPQAESLSHDTVEIFPSREESPPHYYPRQIPGNVVSETTQTDTSESIPREKRNTSLFPETHTPVMATEPLGPPLSLIAPQGEDEAYAGFPKHVIEERGRKLLPCALDFWGWPYLYGQKNADISTVTTDTGSEVRISIVNGKLISVQPREILVFHEGQHGDIHFFMSEHNLLQWKTDHPDVQGDMKTVSEALLWARQFLLREK